MNNELLWFAVCLQVFMGATDTLLHHEFTERLAWQPTARIELKLHALRNVIYAVLFAFFAWGEPFGLLAGVALALIIAEVLITLWDFVEEDLSRKLPPTERVLHTLLALNYGAILILLLPVLWTNMLAPTSYLAVNYGLGSIGLTIASLGVTFFGFRDYFASKRMEDLGRVEAKTLASTLKGRKHILITGATGFIGKRLTKALIDNGHTITVLTRNPEAASTLGTPLSIVTNLDQIIDYDSVDAIINLAGEPLANGFWTKAKRKRIISSRVNMQEAIYRLCQRLYVPPKIIINASAIGWYGLRGEELLTENSVPKASFTHEVCEAVEKGAGRLADFNCRVVNLRIGLVLGTEGGMLANLLVPFEYFAGGPIGNGKQWMSWIDLDDTIRLIIHALQTKDLEGPVNAVAPNPVTNKQFSNALGRALNRPAALPLPAKLLQLVLGDFANELLLASQRVVPEKALKSGFVFQASTVDEALKACLPVKNPQLIKENPDHNNIICVSSERKIN